MLYKMYKCTNVVQKMFQTNDVQKTKTHILCSMILVFFENRGVYEIICQKKKYSRAEEATDNNMAHEHFTLYT